MMGPPGGPGHPAGPSLLFPHRLTADPWQLEIQLGRLRLVGGSVAAAATAFAVDDLGVAVDMGRCSPLLAAQDTVLLTHCHSDHVAGLVAWLSAHVRRHRGAPTRVLVPAPRRDALLQALTAWPDLDGIRRRVCLEEAIQPAVAGQQIDLAGGWARAFAVHHTVPALGWQLGRRGDPRPLAAFAGDGTVRPFERQPDLLDADVAVVECSFLEPGSRVAARLSGHAHLADWYGLAPSLPCRWLVLGHLPPDATTGRLLELLSAWPPHGPTLVPWIAHPDP